MRLLLLFTFTCVMLTYFYNFGELNLNICRAVYGNTSHNITVDKLNLNANGLLNKITNCFTVYKRGDDVMISTFDNLAFEIIKGSFKKRFYVNFFKNILN